MQSHVSAAPDFEGYVWYLFLYILRLRCLVISNTYKNSFCFSSKIETLKTKLSTFQKCIFEFSWVFASIVTKKLVLRTSSDLSTWNNTYFLINCRVTFRLRHTSKATFVTLAHYILRLRCLVIPNTYKNSFCFLSEIEFFQNDVEYVSKMPFWALLGLLHRL